MGICFLTQDAHIEACAAGRYLHTICEVKAPLSGTSLVARAGGST